MVNCPAMSMKTTLVVNGVIVAIIAAAVSSSGQRVIVFTDVGSEKEVTSAEHAWTKKHFPDYRWKNVKLIHDAQLRVYDRVALVNREGGKAIIYFDVTKWNGRHY
jgi:hypothetical protein